MENLQKARELLEQENHTFVMVKGNTVYTSQLKGIKPMYDAVTKYKQQAKGSSIADKVIGKAAALLAVYGGVKRIYAELTTPGAISVCNKYTITISFKQQVTAIQNREKTGLCPMEQLAQQTDVPEEMLQKVALFLTEMAAKKKTEK
ncbi:MAG: DUF1893 domain-containing protein [Salinivirgaceae bacterium]